MKNKNLMICLICSVAFVAVIGYEIARSMEERQRVRELSADASKSEEKLRDMSLDVRHMKEETIAARMEADAVNRRAKERSGER